MRRLRAISQPDAAINPPPVGEWDGHGGTARAATGIEGPTFVVLIVGILAVYLVLQVLYVRRLPLSMDEFQGASALAQFERGVPYRDFSPYKTVLGYYVQLAPFQLGDGTWDRLMAVKLAMVIFNTCALGFAVLYLSRIYSRIAVVCGLALTIVMSNFLERSSELRVDMLTGWAGLASLLLLLNARNGWAGIAAGLSFLISQKGLYYCIAGTTALLGLSLLAGPDLKSARSVVRFSSSAVAIVGAYVGLWALWAGLDRVLYATFLSPRRIALQGLYAEEQIRLRFWSQTLCRNPVFYSLGLLALGRVAGPRSALRDHPREWLLVLYALTLIALAALHQQPWPYFFVLIIPTVFVLIVALIDWNWRERGHWCPLGRSRLIVGLCILLGVVYPMSRIPVNLSRDSGFQRQMVALAEHVLAPEDTYVAGVDLLYRVRQAVGTLRWLDLPRRQMLQQMPAAGVAALIDSLERSPLKVAIDNYRLDQLPAPLRNYLASTTSFLWGNVRIYSPLVGPGDTALLLKFSGRYGVQAPAGGAVSIDGRPVAPGSVINLTRGPHRSASSSEFRLKLLPDGWESRVTEAYRAPRDLFPNVYTY